MPERQASHRVTQPGGVRLRPPAGPPAPPAGPPGPPGQGPPSPSPPDFNPGGSVVLGRYLEECLLELALIRNSLETLEIFREPADSDLVVEMRRYIGEARFRLVQKLSEIVTRWRVGPDQLADHQLRGFHRAMLKVITQGIDDSLWARWVSGTEFSSGRRGERFRYAPLHGGSFEALSQSAPTALVRFILDDLAGELGLDNHFQSLTGFELTVYRKFLAVLFACYLADDPLLFPDV